jgi:hypothetical protein
MAQAASGLSVTSSVDRTDVALGDPITLSVSVSGAGGSTPDPILPDLSNFEVYSSGKNTSISVVNGKFTSTLELTYVLVPKKIGTLAIGPVVVKEKGATISSNPIRISVTKPGAIGQAPKSGGQQEDMRIAHRTDNFFITKPLIMESYVAAVV